MSEQRIEVFRPNSPDCPEIILEGFEERPWAGAAVYNGRLLTFVGTNPDRTERIELDHDDDLAGHGYSSSV